MDNSYQRILDELVRENKRLNDCQIQSNQIMSQMMDYVENLSKELEQLRSLVNVNRSQILSLPYELADPDYVSPIFKPRFYSASETRRLVSEGKSIGRLGDGEFAAIAGEKRWNFQDVSAKLGEKIKDTLDAAGYLSKAFAQMLAGKHHYTRSRNLKNPDIETKTLDVRYLPDAEELEAIIKCPREYAAVFFPDYDLIDEPEIRQSSYMPGCYVKMELIRRNDPVLIREEKHSSYLLHQANDFLGFKNRPKNKIQKWKRRKTVQDQEKQEIPCFCP